MCQDIIIDVIPGEEEMVGGVGGGSGLFLISSQFHLKDLSSKLISAFRGIMKLFLEIYFV